MACISSTSASTRARASTSTRARASASARQIVTVSLHQSIIWLAPCHHISQSFDLPTATTSSVSASASASARELELALLELALEIELELELDIHYCITASVNHLTCPLPPHHHSFDLPTATTSSVRASTRDRASAIALDIEHYSTTASVSHLTCPLPPHQSVIWLAHCHHIISQS